MYPAKMQTVMTQKVPCMSPSQLERKSHVARQDADSEHPESAPHVSDRQLLQLPVGRGVLQARVTDALRLVEARVQLLDHAEAA